MEHFELVEKLVKTFGVSYEKAKEALEVSNWDPIDAAIYLEREKNGNPEPVKENVSQESAAEQPQAETQAQTGAQAQAQTEEKAEPNRGTKGSFNIPVDDMKQAGSDFFMKIWDFLNKNTFVVKKNSGEVFLEIPIWLAALLLCAFFWAVVVVLGIVFIMGYRFSFSGPQLGKKRVKNTVDQVENAAGDFVSKVKNAVAPDNCEPVAEQPEIIVEEKNADAEKPAEAEVTEEVKAEEAKTVETAEEVKTEETPSSDLTE